MRERTGADNMKQLIELSIRGDMFFFLDTLTPQQHEIVSTYAKKRFGKHDDDVSACQIEEFIAEVERCYAITLERLCISKVIAI